MKNNVKKGNPGTKKTTAQRKQPAAAKKASGKPIVLTTLIVGAVGVLGYFGWQYYQKRKSSKSRNSDMSALLPSTPKTNVYNNNELEYIPSTATPAYVAPVTNSIYTPSVADSITIPIPKPTPVASGFPLKKGTKSALVKNLQQALIAKYGASILPKYGADGDFGSETVAALKKAGLPATIDQSTYYVFVQGSGGGLLMQML